MSPYQTYRESLLTALDCLEEAEGHAMAAILNIAFSGPYQELGKLYDVGEILDVDYLMFEGTEDSNIDLVIQLVKKIQRTRETIRNINALEMQNSVDPEEE